MNYHNITTDDMMNGSGLRVVLWVSGCNHHCSSCQNPQTWDKNSGINFDFEAENELFEKLNNDYISGITFTGGDPLCDCNLSNIENLCIRIKEQYPNKTIWLYTGYTWEEIINDNTNGIRKRIVSDYCDVLVDGRFEKDKSDINYPYAGSSNQRIIDIKKTLQTNKVILFEE